MNPNEPKLSNESAKAWFEGTGAPIAQLPQPSPRSHKKRTILVVAIVLLVVSLIVAGVLSIVTAAKPCLTPEDYQAFTGSKPDSQLSPQAFYTKTFSFTNGTSSYVSSDDNDETFKKIGELYKKNSNSKSIQLTIIADYFEEDDRQSAEQRILKLKDALLEAGVNASAITIKKPEAVFTVDELADDSEELAVATAYVRVASATNCKQ